VCSLLPTGLEGKSSLEDWVSLTTGNDQHHHPPTQLIRHSVEIPRFSLAPVVIPAFPSVTGGPGHGTELLAVSITFLLFIHTSSSPTVSDTATEFHGLTIVQVSQNQAAVVSDPQNHIFVIKNAGFVAFAIEGTYDVLAIVDQTHLPGVVKDRLTGVILGWTHEIKMKSQIGAGKEQEYIVATLYASFRPSAFYISDHPSQSLNIPASNCAILQRGDDLELLGAGQSVITNPSVTLRGLYTLGENQLEMPTKDMYVPPVVSMTWH